MRAIFYLRTIGGNDAIEGLCKALADKSGSTLFRHEVAYVLGQMQAVPAISTLVAVLSDAEDDPIVRHESGEALGAVAEPSTLEILEKFSTDVRPEVAETCQIAASRVRWAIENKVSGADNVKGTEGNLNDNPFESVDPAPADKKPSSKDIPKYQQILTDQNIPLFDRYKAMFSLRNNGSKAAVLALCTGLTDPSPLFRHEVAYVLGQLAHPASAEALMKSVTDGEEHEMVRHEAAEAIGAIGTSDCVEFLEKYKDSPAVMLRESCVVALDAVDYWNMFTNNEEKQAEETAA